jgi:hypothetical protein
MARKSMKSLPAPAKLADADLGSVAGASGGWLDASWVGVTNISANYGSQASLFNGNGSGPLSGNTSQSMTQSNSTGTVIVHG